MFDTSAHDFVVSLRSETHVRQEAVHDTDDIWAAALAEDGDDEDSDEAGGELLWALMVLAPPLGDT